MVDRIYDDPALHREIADFAASITPPGRSNSLSQKLVQLAMPGVPDIYQGTEMWDDSLVDPDNRRPVDYTARTAALAEIRARRIEGAAFARELTLAAPDGRIKLFVTHVALDARRRLPDVFVAQGAYIPQAAAGAQAEHVIAFTRRAGSAEIVLVAPRLLSKLC